MPRTIIKGAYHIHSKWDAPIPIYRDAYHIQDGTHLSTTATLQSQPFPRHLYLVGNDLGDGLLASGR